MIVEGWIYHHSIRLDETIRMSYGTAFHDPWTARYLAKRQKSACFIFENADFWRFVKYLAIQWLKKDEVTTIRFALMRRFEWAMVQPSVIIGRRDI